jgi:hypothetical protein
VKRVFWGLVGVGLGAAVGVGLTRWARRTAEQLAPQSVLERAVAGSRELWTRLAEAVEEGRAAMAEREAELRALYAEQGSEAR